MDHQSRDIFIIGAKSVGQYGGYETFVDKLTEAHQHTPLLRYRIAVKANGPGCMDETALTGVSDIRKDADGSVRSFRYHNAEIFKLQVPELGPAAAILYDVRAVKFFLRYCREQGIEKPVFYILACRIGPFIGALKRKIRAAGGVLIVNPDGHEWKRSKWSAPVRKYWKLSEKQMVRHADVVIPDARAIEDYIRTEYAAYDPRTVYISYGADIVPSPLTDDDPAFLSWLNTQGVQARGYDLVVGRLVPENNYETMVREYMKSASKRKLVLITDLQEDYLAVLEKKLHYSEDPRIIFAGPLYQPELLKKIRENAFLYLHGHSVGGTNPSLLEALGSTELNLLYDVSFNREVGADAALYWTTEEGDLSALLSRAETLTEEERRQFAEKAKARIRENYSWEKIAAAYEELFLKA